MGRFFACLLLGLIAGSAGAQGTYPDRPIRLIVGFPVGVSVDLMARLVADGLRAELKQPVIVENRPGADGLIGAKAVADAPPNGYTLALTTNGIAGNMVLLKNPGYDAVKGFAHLGIYSILPWVLVTHPSFSARTVPDLVAYGKANPGKLAVGYYSPGGRLNIFMLRTGGKFEVLEVPYKGPAQMLPDLASSQLQAFFLPIEQGFTQERNGFVRVLGVTTAKRQSIAPNVPAVAETIPGYEMYSWQGVAAPTGTPKDVLVRLQTAFNAAISTQDFRERLAKLGGVPASATPEEVAARINADMAVWRGWMKDAGVQQE